MKIVLPGGAGLVGQNLIVQLIKNGYSDITVIDKHSENVGILKKIEHSIEVVEDDLSVIGAWENCLKNADVVVMLLRYFKKVLNVVIWMIFPLLRVTILLFQRYMPH